MGVTSGVTPTPAATTAATVRPASPRATGRRAPLGLDHVANIVPLAHVVLYLAVLAFALASPWSPIPYVAVPLMFVLAALSYSVTMGVLHVHAHRPLFVADRANRVFDVLACLAAVVSTTDYREQHILNHHRFSETPRDVTSTVGWDRGGRAVLYWARYGLVIKAYAIRHLFGRDATPASRRRRRAWLVDNTIAMTVVVGLTVAVIPGRMLLFYWIPFLSTMVNVGFFGWVTHAPARGFDGPSADVNLVGNWLNLLYFNQGYHSIHHRYPGLHWSEVPAKLSYLLDVEPEVIVPYGCTVVSAWRIAAADRWHDAAFGAAWKAALAERLATGAGVRSRFLPWFAWT